MLDLQRVGRVRRRVFGRHAQHHGVEAVNALGDARDVEFARVALRAEAPEERALRGMLGERDERGAQRHGVLGLDEDGVLSAARHPGDAAAGEVARDERLREAHCFHQHEAERLRALARGQAEDVAGRHEIEERGVVDPAREPDARARAARRDGALERASLFAFARDHELQPRLGRHGGDQRVESLVVGEASGRQHAQSLRLPRLAARRGLHLEPPRRHAERDHVALVVPGGERLARFEVLR